MESSDPWTLRFSISYKPAASFQPTPFEFRVNGKTVALRIVGGLLGQWACWTKRAVEHLQQIRDIQARQAPVPLELLIEGAQLTHANQAIFDADHNFKGCIPGILHVL